MKTYNFKSIAAKSLLAVFCTALFSFSTGKGGDAFEIFLNGKRVLQQYVHVAKGVETLHIDKITSTDKMDIYYSHCGTVGKSRYITVKDEHNRALKVWKFEDASKGYDAMSLPVKDILAAGKGANNLSIFYSSKELPGGKELAVLDASSEAIAVAKK